MPVAGPQYGRQGGRSGSEDQSLLRYWRVLRQRLWLIVMCVVLALIGAGAYVKVAPRTYTAQAELEIQATSSSQADPALSVLPVLHSSGNPTEDVLTAASMVTTQPVAAAVVSSLKLHLSPSAALGHISASPIGQAGLVAVVATASTPSLAQRLANGFVTQTIAVSTARMHGVIASLLPKLRTQLAQTPPGQRFGPGSVGATLQELEQLAVQNDPTLINAAPAILPAAPTSPKKSLALVAGLVGGLLIGIAAAFIFHALDPLVRREEQLRERLGRPILARIPRQRRARPRPLLPSELSPGAQEAYRTLRTVLAARGPASEPRALLITGSAPGEGKSTIAIGLAAALAQGGARVIMIEADIRKPTFATSLRLPDYQGIEQVLDGQVGLVDALVPARVDGVTVNVLAAHPSPGDQPGLPSFMEVRELVEDAKALADFVVIDSAPLTAVIDALPFARAADDVLVVVRLDSTRLNRLVELDDLLDQHGINQIGLVLIGGAPLKGPGYYYSIEQPGLGRPDASGSAETGSARSRSGLLRG